MFGNVIEHQESQLERNLELSEEEKELRGLWELGQVVVTNTNGMTLYAHGQRHCYMLRDAAVTWPGWLQEVRSAWLR